MANNTEDILFNLKIEENRATKKLKEVKEAISSLDRRTTKYKNTVKQQIELENKLIQIRQKRVGVNKQMKSSVEGLTKAQVQAKDATGSATSSVMELSRVVSDAPYGIRGMANNITQLVSQMGTASTKAGGLTVALKLMWKQLLGPLGIVFAITAVISAIDYFYGGMKKAEEATEDWRGSIAKAGADLKIFMSLVDKTTTSEDELKESVTALNKKYKDLNVEIDSNGELTKESVVQINNKILALEKLAKATAIQGLIEESYAKILTAELKMQDDISENLKKLGAKDLEDFRKNKDELIKVQEGYYKGSIDANKLHTEANISRKVREYDELKKTTKDGIDDLLKIIDDEDLFGSIFGKGGKSSSKSKTVKLPSFIDIKSFEADILNIERILVAARERELMAFAKTEEEKLKVKQQLEEEALLKSFDNVKLKNEKELTDFVNNVDDKLKKGKITEETAEKAKKQAEKEKIAKNTKSHENYLIALTKISEKYKAKIDVLGSEDDSSKEGEKASLDDILNERLEKYKKYAELAKGILSSITGFIDGEFDRELAIEKNKTNAINNELNQRLLNESLSKDERKNIQNQIAKNDEALRKKQESIEKKRFEMNKAASISKAVVDTYAAAVGVMKDASGGFFSRLAQAVPTIAFGLAQVATIARQKFVSSAGAKSPILSGGASAGSSGGADRSFNFNLVGNTQANQIADAIQGRFKQPLKAFVVSRDITTQQELDANIKGSASF